MGELIDLRLVFEEKRLIDASARVERCSTELLFKALGDWRSQGTSAQMPGQLVQLSQRRDARADAHHFRHSH